MRLTVDIKGLDAATKELTEALSARRIASVAAAALTRAAVAGRAAVQREMAKDFDRPTPYTLGSVRYTAATPQRLEAEVYISEQRGARDPSPAVVLKPQVEGGKRGFKGLELALRAAGALPAGWYVTPGAHARLDAYGNVSRGQITQVIAFVRRQAQFGPKDRRRLMKGVRQAGGKFFVIPPGGPTQPGVYLADVIGRNALPVFIFVNRATYRKRLDFDQVVQREAARVLPALLAQGFGESVGRLAGGAGSKVIR